MTGIDPDAVDAPYRIEFHERIESTNDRGRELAESGEDGVAVVAAEQTAGRGRRDREWIGPEGGVYCSVVLAPEMDPADYPVVTLAAAVATARAVRRTGAAATIKWPNDVLLDGEKLAGILTERVGDRVVVGVGINAETDRSSLPEGSATLASVVDDVDRTSLVEDLCSELSTVLGDPESILPAWRELADTLGRGVAVETPDGTVEGTAEDVEWPGTLLVDTGDGTVRVNAGDCRHLRPIDDE